MDKKLITVGQLAKIANVSTRTIQYYDIIDLLKPSLVKDNGRRMYDEKDIATLHQIKTLKSFGLSLKEIQERLMPVESSIDVVKLLERQSMIIREQIAKAEKVLGSIEMLQKDIQVSDQVDWEKYSEILRHVDENDEYYWVLKFLDEDILERITEVHQEDENPQDSIEWFRNCLKRAIDLKAKGEEADSDEAQSLASEWWSYVQLYTKGDPVLMEQIYGFYLSADQWPGEFGDIHKQAKDFFEKTIELFLERNNHV